MKFFQLIFNRFKEILFIPINLVNIERHSSNLIRLENQLEALNQKLNDLDIESISKKLVTLSQNQVNEANIKTKESINVVLSEVIFNIQERFENHFLQLESLLSIYNSLPNLKFLPASRGWAGSPDFLAKIVELIIKEKPRFVLEVSSGVSTIIIGSALKSNNSGKVVSLDHERIYAETTMDNIIVNNLDDNTTVIHCSLREYNGFEQDYRWYDIDKLDLHETIDLLVIDGPPRSTQFLARYPAIPLLHKYFSNPVLIVLDDANRDDERIIVKKWIDFLKENDFTVEVTKLEYFEKGMVILKAGRLNS